MSLNLCHASYCFLLLSGCTFKLCLARSREHLEANKHDLFIAGVILASLESRLGFVQRHLAMVDGVFWRGDHTFQAASRIRSDDGRKDYAAVYSTMNEWLQIVGQWAVGDTSFDQYRSGVADVLKRYADRGYEVCMHTPVCNY